MTTTPTDERIETRRAALAKARAERLDPLDYPRTWTQRQVNTYDAETAILDRQIAHFATTVETWTARPPIEPDTRWLAHLTSWRTTLCDELLTIKSPIRDKDTKARADSLTFSLRLIDFGWAVNRLPAPVIDLSSTRVGELMAAAGYDVVGLELLRGPNGFRGSLPDTEQRVKTLTARRAAAEAALASVLRTDEERAQQEAESAQLREAFNRLHVRGSADGLGYTVVDEDGAPRDLATLTATERQAFERADAAERAYRQSVFNRQSGRHVEVTS
jgi:hypothetical protein